MAPSQGFAPHDAKVRIRNVQARLMQVYSGPVGPGLEQALGTLQNAMDIWFRSGYSEHMVFFALGATLVQCHVGNLGETVEKTGLIFGFCFFGLACAVVPV